MVSHQNLFLGLLPSPTTSAPGRASSSSLTPAAHNAHTCPDAYSISLPWRTQRASQPCATNKNLFYNEHSFFFFLAIYLVALGLSCSMWDLVPWPGIKPRPPTLGAQSPSTEPPGGGDGLVAKSCPMWPHGLQPARRLCSWDSPGQEYWSGLPFPSPGDLPDPGSKPRSPELQADSLPTEL